MRLYALLPAQLKYKILLKGKSLETPGKSQIITKAPARLARGLSRSSEAQGSPVPV